MSWLRNVLIGIDQLGNTVAGGNPDVTVSARVGYNAKMVKGKTRHYWLLMELLINFTFYPDDGPNHCYEAYMADKNEEHKHGSDWMRFILSVFIIVGCIFLSVITRLYVLIFPKAHYSKLETNQAT